jgi:hypothetical protein
MSGLVQRSCGLLDDRIAGAKSPLSGEKPRSENGA